MKWDDESYKKILIELVAQEAITWNYKLIAENIGCTERAIKEQAQKLRRECREAGRLPEDPKAERMKKDKSKRKGRPSKKEALPTTTDDEEQSASDDVTGKDDFEDSMEEERGRKRRKQDLDV